MANSIEIWLGLVHACMEKWHAEKCRLFDNWAVFDLPVIADGEYARRWEPWMISWVAPIALPPDAAAEWAAKWNAKLDEWDCFHAAARGEFQALWARPQSGAAGKKALRKKRALYADISDLLSRPSEPEPSQAHHEIWDRLARKRREAPLPTD